MYKLGYPDFRDQILAGIDPYTAVARMVTDKDEVTDEERQVWKRIYLAILYGAGPKRVREVWIEETKTTITIAEAKRIYKKFHRNWPAVRALQDSVVTAHESRGHIKSIVGRHLHMEEFGDYKLANKLIQGSAADIMKQALLKVDQWITGGLVWEEARDGVGMWLTRSDYESLRARTDIVVPSAVPIQSRMVSVIHDEIIFDGPEHEIPILHEAIPPLMVNETVNAVVPIAVDHEVSLTTWAEKMDYDEWEEMSGARQRAA